MNTAGALGDVPDAPDAGAPSPWQPYPCPSPHVASMRCDVFKHAAWHPGIYKATLASGFQGVIFPSHEIAVSESNSFIHNGTETNEMK
jgi:hypothetical protein